MEKYIPALGYDFLSGWYDRMIRWTMPEAQFRKMLTEQADVQAHEKVLDFGFGTASQTILLKKSCPSASIIGLDIDPNIRQLAIEKITKAGLSIQLDLYNGTTFPYADHSFDKVVSSLVFHQLTKAQKLNCLKEIYRVLKPNGEIHIGDWGKAANGFMRTAFVVVQLLDGFSTTSDNVKGRLPHFLKKVGFSQVAEVEALNTLLGTFSFYTGIKPAKNE